MSEALSGEPILGTPAEFAQSEGVKFVAGEVAARLDRLPLTSTQWRLSLTAEAAWGIVIAGDGFAAVLYPFLWTHNFSHYAYSWLNAVQVGVGILLGEWIGGYLSDRFGRRTILAVGALVYGVFIIGLSQVGGNYLGLLLMSLGQSTGIGFMLATNATYMHEVVPPQVRGRITQASQASTVVWLTLGLIMGYYWVPSHYQWYLALLGVGAILVTPVLWRLPESPRWLESKGRHAEAIRNVERLEAATIRHGHTLVPVDREYLRQHPVGVTVRPTVRELFRGEYGRRTAFLLIAWVLGYSGIVYGFGSYEAIQLVALGFSAQEFFLLLIITGSIGYGGGLLLFSIWNEKFERRTLPLIGAVVFTAGFIPVWAFGYLANNHVMEFVGYGILNVGSGMWLFNMYNYTAACYPTRLRSLGTGWTDGVGHLGSIFGPVVVVALGDATAKSGWWGFMVYCAIAGALVPSLLIYFTGVKQQRATLEQVST
jgi:MFS family permease